MEKDALQLNFTNKIFKLSCRNTMDTKVIYPGSGVDLSESYGTTYAVRTKPNRKKRQDFFEKL
jgi:hypothetical protein